MHGCKSNADLIHARHGLHINVQRGEWVQIRAAHYRTAHDQRVRRNSEGRDKLYGIRILECGEMAEWSMAVVLKTTDQTHNAR
jgi:hypothetical protein